MRDFSLVPTLPSLPSNPGIADLIRIIDEHLPLATGSDGSLYYYSGGVYRPGGDRAIAQLLARVCEETKTEFRTKTLDTLIRYWESCAPRLVDPDLRVVNVKNCLVHVDPLSISPHRPDYLTSVQLPIVYDPNATCPTWHDFISDVFPPDAIELAWQIVAWLCVPYTAIQKAIILVGEGANGKSLFLYALTELLGRDNVSAVSLHSIENDRFAVSQLVGKLANICADIPTSKLMSTAKFKGIVSGDLITAEAKYRSHFEFRPFCRLVFSTNALAEHSDQAWFRRLVIVPFSRSFREDPAIERELKHRLKSELSGALNEALCRIPYVLEHGLAIPPSVDRAVLTYRGIQDPMAAWLLDNTVTGPDLFTPTEMLHQDFLSYVRERDIPPGSLAERSRFARMLRTYRPQLRFRTSQHRRVTGYLGIGLKAGMWDEGEG